MLQLHFILPNLAVSNRPALYEAPLLQHAGITAILNTTLRPDPHWPIPTLQDPTPDDGMHKSAAWFGKGISFVLRNMHNGRVLIHCESGIHRSPSMAYAVLRAMGRDPAQASFLVLKHVPGAFLRYQADADQAIKELGYENT